MQMHMERAEEEVGHIRGHICRCRWFGTATTEAACVALVAREDIQKASALPFCKHIMEASAAIVGATAAARERRWFVMVLRGEPN